MIVRAHRLARAHRVLPRVARRTIAEETSKAVPNDDSLPTTILPGPEPQETQHVAEMRKKLDLQKKARESLKMAVQNPFEEIQDKLSGVQSPATAEQEPANEVQRPLSEVHWALIDGYEIGGHLEHGKGPLNKFDGKGLPTWGKWGVVVKLTGWQSTSLVL
jgi:hypothetical protein